MEELSLSQLIQQRDFLEHSLVKINNKINYIQQIKIPESVSLELKKEAYAIVNGCYSSEAGLYIVITATNTPIRPGDIFLTENGQGNRFEIKSIKSRSGNDPELVLNPDDIGHGILFITIPSKYFPNRCKIFKV
jgi:hypothetical protein